MREKILGYIELDNRLYRFVEKRSPLVPIGCRLITLQEERDGKAVPVKPERKIDKFNDRIEKRLSELISRKEH